jgi:hypothetical protein
MSDHEHTEPDPDKREPAEGAEPPEGAEAQTKDDETSGEPGRPDR